MVAAMARLPERRGPRPGGNGRGPLESIAAVNSDNSDHSLEIPFSQLRHRPIGPGELAALRAVWWRQATQGHRLPAERGIILITRGAK